MKYTTIKLALFALVISFLSNFNVLASNQTDIIGPAGSGQFGQQVVALPNGNIVVSDPFYDAPGPKADVGAVRLYNGATGALISALTGGTANDQVGINGITPLTNGNYVVNSINWDNPSWVTNNNVGAVTWCSGTGGCSGIVSEANSLVGGSVNDVIGSDGITVLSNGNYVVRSPAWNNPLLSGDNDAGAVTWGNGAVGTVGLVSVSNSLVGGSVSDRIGTNGITALSNGNYVVSSLTWDSPTPLVANVGAITWGNGGSGTVGLVSAGNSLVGNSFGDAIGNGGITALTNGNYVVSSLTWDNPLLSTNNNGGAATWGNGMGGTVGLVSASNSLVGGSTDDVVGSDGISTLTNGNYVVSSPGWDNPLSLVTNVGATTWGNGAVGTVGIVSASNSLVGGSAEDAIGNGGITALTNGNYVVSSGYWDNASPLKQDVGAATWGNGLGGTVGLVSVSNSLMGDSADDAVGINGITELSNGNYVVSSPNWDNPSPLITNVGAATWGNGGSGTVGLVSAGNSLVGGSADDNISGYGITVLSNGNYVVNSVLWDSPTPLITNVGAVAWGNGAGGTVGLVTASNSLIGGTAFDNIGAYGIFPLTNGNYVVSSAEWDNPSPLKQDVGAATWGNGAGGTVGVVSASNSSVGGTADDRVSSYGIFTLTNGNYVMSSPGWDSPSPLITNVGAATWGNGASGTVGIVSASNSLVGGTADDNVGNSITALSNGSYMVSSSSWDNPSGSIVGTGAISYGSGVGGTVGLISAFNSVRGTTGNGGGSQNSIFDTVNNQLVVGRPADNIVTLFKPPALGKEADVNPRPSQSPNPNPGQSGDGFVTAGDVTQIRRFALGLDTPDAAPNAANEFQKADCAPRQNAQSVDTFGDGIIASGDVTQARRYALGLDIAQLTRGPVSFAQQQQVITNVLKENLYHAKTNDNRSNGASNRSTVSPVLVSKTGNRLTIGIVLNTDAAETAANSLSFTLNYDTKDLTSPTNIRLGNDAHSVSNSSASLAANYTRTDSGRLGILLDLAPQETFSFGERQLVLIDFTIAAGAQTTTTLKFDDSLAARFSSDADGSRLDREQTFVEKPITINESVVPKSRKRIQF